VFYGTNEVGRTRGADGPWEAARPLRHDRGGPNASQPAAVGTERRAVLCQPRPYSAGGS